MIAMPADRKSRQKKEPRGGHRRGAPWMFAVTF
jgi:hypothetical protein